MLYRKHLCFREIIFTSNNLLHSSIKHNMNIYTFNFKLRLLRNTWITAKFSHFNSLIVLRTGTGSCKHSNEPSGSIKCGEVLDYLRDSSWKSSVSWSGWVNFLSVQKRIKERSIISEQEITHYILLAINNTMINLKIAELLKNFTLSCNPKYHWHRQTKKKWLPHPIRYHMYPVCIQKGYFSNLLLILFC
jgi:hypothetical protein